MSGLVFLDFKQMAKYLYDICQNKRSQNYGDNNA